MSTAVDPRLLTRARELVASCTGFRDDAISLDAVERVVRAELLRGRSLVELLADMQWHTTPLAQSLVRAALVGETYFFRHPEHFRFIAAEGVPSALRRGALRLRGWSAGCATGEETYSLAACLLGSAPQGFPVEVLGTDLHEESLTVARRAQYGSWSRRESGPHLFPLYQPLTERLVVIHEHVRAVTTFTSTNLLAAPPESFGRFDFILCRNVLTYFTPAARETAIGHLTRALVPGGFLFLGTVEVDRVPPGLVRVATPELQIFRLPLPSESAPSKPPPAPPKPAPVLPRVAARAPEPQAPEPPAAPSVPQPARLHLEALERIEHGDVSGAGSLLETLVKQAPEYLPGLLELALLRVRAGARDEAYPLMRALYTRAAKLPPDQLIDGPEALPARFYRASADAYLNLGAVE
ncbi:CheR family methyltransferase [Myxococcaceae bacterium GXIMD 01537]